MKIAEIVNLFEGGWSSSITQTTTINPKVVKQVLALLHNFTNDFNKFLKSKNLEPIRVGKPTGSSAYHDVDIDDKVYGDIDMQMVGQNNPNLTPSQYAAYYNKLVDEFIVSENPSYLNVEEHTTGHPIFKIGHDQYVQVDFMWHSPDLETWGVARTTPERGMKGMLYGNMFSVLGEILDMSIQHAGVQMKLKDGVRVPFSKQKDVTVKTISTNPQTFIYDIFKYLAKEQDLSGTSVTKDLKNNRGVDMSDPKIFKMIDGVVAFADNLQRNDMFGKYSLSNIPNKRAFLNKFLDHYTKKIVKDLEGSKREKASTSQAIERANLDREKITKGLEIVTQYFKEKSMLA
jgi:hypothetical protein